MFGSSEFRRGQMTQVGCSYILRRKIDYYTTLGENVKSGNVGFLTCVYYAHVEKLDPLSGNSNVQNCNKAVPEFLNGAVLNEFGYYPSLCTSRFVEVILQTQHQRGIDEKIA